jgi:hypothetical protein
MSIPVPPVPIFIAKAIADNKAQGGKNMTKTDESLQKLVDTGIIGKCEKHGEIVYFNASEDCPTCAEKPVKKVKGKVQSLIKAEPEPAEPQGFIDKLKAMPTKKKLILGIVAFGIMWIALNYGAIMSYFR